jgi:hypothetical protein
MIKSHKLDASSVKPVERAAKYLVNNTQLLHYVSCVWITRSSLADNLHVTFGIPGPCADRR